MKKIIGVLLGCMLMFVIHQNVHAQSNLTNAAGRSLDTVTNTGTKVMTSGRVTGHQQTVTISTVNVNLTGTQSGVARLYGSLDGVNYQRIRSNQLHNSQVDSLVINVNSNKYAWVVDNNPFVYYQVQTTGIGTVTFSVAGKYVAH